MKKSKNNIDLDTIGEFGLIRLLTENVKLKNESSLFGVGDDAAILDMKGNKTVVTTDLLTEGIHFDLVYTPISILCYESIILRYLSI